MRLRDFSRAGNREKLELAAMIDVVFLLLIFFIMSLRIAAIEGDFNVKMPTLSSGVDASEEFTVFVRLAADENGNLAGVSVNQRALTSEEPFAALHAEVVRILGPQPEPKESAISLQP